MTTPAAGRSRGPVVYPSSDGKPMAETERHRDLMIDLIQTLDAHFATVPDVWVSGNLLLYYVQGDRRRHVSPDVFVVRGSPKPTTKRDCVLLWEEPQPPWVVLELTSSSTRSEDTGRKLTLYRDVLRVREYFLFDPTSDYLDTPLQGYRLRAGAYQRMLPRDRTGRLLSRGLGLLLVPGAGELRLANPDTGTLIPLQRERLAQEQAQRVAAEARATHEQAQRQSAEARATAAEAELERLRAELARQPKTNGSAH